MYYVIANPVSGNGRGRQHGESVRSLLEEKKVPYEFTFTAHRGHATTLVSALPLTIDDRLIIVGGDGTINEAVNGISKFDSCVLGIIPSGTGNDFCRPLGIPLDVPSALKLAMFGTPKPTDIMKADERKVVCFATSGIDIDIVRGCNELKHKRPSSYLRVMLRELLKNKTFEFAITHSGKEERVQAFMAGAVNNGQIATGMILSPAASVDDGELDFVIVERVPRIKQLGLLTKLYNGKLLTHPAARLIRTSEINVVPLTEHTVDLDGELYPTEGYTLSIATEKLLLVR